MTLDRLDLNLLRVFEAVYLERSVTRAGRRLGMEQSSVSNALGRLRVAMGDELFVRTARGVEPTERAHALAGPLVQALAGLRDAFAATAGFDPGTAKGRVDIGLSLEAEIMLGAGLLRRLAADAPGLSPRFHMVTAESLPELLMRDDILLALGDPPDPPAQITALSLIPDAYAVLLRPNHPALEQDWTLDRYLAQEHLVLTCGGVDGAVDRRLAMAGPGRRRVAASMAHPLPAAAVLAENDLCWTVTGSLARLLAPAFGLRHLPLPLDLPPPQLSLCWHRRHDGDGRHIWLRRVAAEAVRDAGNEVAGRLPAS
ncbi:LysR family transcriptional regulator [Indioceanicola profundi]|uniref:LysR family transcriptional regulator n=1 Tax=Indioceanicola profundi TaxID=2220096 RepID=UPI000E6ACF3C|nr:LysR family transcriptional regulator [Indioceanicola profundi]